VDSPTWLSSLNIARNVVQGAYGDITEGATHYHAISVTPYWADSLNETVRITDHIFYK
jgi:spore germination cell wall hydrolase CwlJ-like protein